MSLILFLKPIFDMLYQYKILSIIIIVAIFLLFILYGIKKKQYLDKINVLVFCLILLNTFSLFKNVNIDSIGVYIKILSNFAFFYLGKMLFYERKKHNRILFISYTLIFIVNLGLFLFGKGFEYLGSAHTFKGLYYFKTDLALAITQFFIMYLYTAKHFKGFKLIILDCLIISLSFMLIFRSNARIYLLIFPILLFAYFMYKYDEKRNINFTIKFKTILIVFILFIGSLYLLNLLGNSTFFTKNNLISVKFNNLDDLFNGANTQGRNLTWNYILNYFNAQNFITKLFGVDLISDSIINANDNYDSHNMYIKALFTTGYLGLILFLILIILLIKQINSINDITYKFMFLSFVITFILSGVSYSTQVHTQQMSIFMYLAGITCGLTKDTNRSIKLLKSTA